MVSDGSGIYDHDDNNYNDNYEKFDKYDEYNDDKDHNYYIKYYYHLLAFRRIHQ